MDVRAEVLQAEERIRAHIRETYLTRPHFLNQESVHRVHCKLENLQHTGSFKVRGALSKLLSLPDDVRRRGVVAASTGNHGAAVAYALQVTGTPGVIFVTQQADPAKIEAIERLKAEVRFYGADCLATETQARAYAAGEGMIYISPYNDPRVIGGQGTLALELTRQLERFDEVYVALGGGGLISGVAGYLKTVHPQVRIIGCSPANSQVMIQSIRAGRILDLPSRPTLSDATAGGVEPGAVTFDLCRELVDDFVTVSEDEIRAALRDFIAGEHMLIEGAAAVPLAAYRKSAGRPDDRQVVIVICGANIGTDILQTIL